jgi:hypothetical protein
VVGLSLDSTSEGGGGPAFAVGIVDDQFDMIETLYGVGYRFKEV